MMIPNCSKRILIRFAALASVFTLTLVLSVGPGETAQIPSPPRAKTPAQPQTPPGQPAAPLPSVKAVTVVEKGAIG